MTRKLIEIFNTYREFPWLLVRPLGNWGDHLLYAGAERLATVAGLDWSSCETFDFSGLVASGRHCIYLQGGGGLNDWSSGRAFVNLQTAVSRRAPIVVQGPASVGGSLQMLRERFTHALANQRCKEVVMYSRELQSHQLLSELGLEQLGLTLELDHDTALSLKAVDLLELAGLDAMPDGRYHLVVCREDNEQPDHTADRGRGAFHTNAICLDPAREALTFRQWLRIHLFAREITSNRLHSAIAGTVAGKPVTLSAGSYHKNRQVWEYSLADRSVGWAPAISLPASPLWSRLPGRIRSSHKVRRARLALHGVPLS